MRLTVTIPDAVHDGLVKEASTAKLPVEDLMLARSMKLSGTQPSDRILILAGSGREALEQLLGGGHLASVDDLIAKVKRRASIRLGSLDMNFSAGQLEELQRRCERLGVDPKDEMRRIVEKISELFFDHVGV